MSGYDEFIRSIRDLPDRMLIKHHIGRENSTSYGVVNSPKGVIEYAGKEYKSLNQFVMQHYADANHSRQTVNAWAECWAQFGSEWKSMLNIPKE
jgi:hypothetical protein